MAEKNLIPSVLAFEKKLVPSDGYLYGTIWEERFNENKCIPLHLKEKSVRGTNSYRIKDKSLKNDTKLESDIKNANIQTVDSCSLNIEQDTLKLSYTLKVLKGLETPSACDLEAFLKQYRTFLEEYINEYKFEELGKRYAYNIANARTLWRNRVGAEQIEVIVKIENDDLKEKTYKFNAFDYKLNDFQTDSQIEELGELIAETLSGKREYLLLDIDVYAQVGYAQDVYPSEELVLNKNKNKNEGEKSKILYSIDDIAAIHSQKIGNAIRTIDTWYSEFNENGQKAIAVEPYGAVTNMGKIYRQPKKDDFYTLFDKCVFKTDLTIDSNIKHYVMAVLVRGGVFGESKNKNEKE